MQTQHKHAYTHQKNYHFQRRRISFFVKVQSLITFTLLLFFSMNQNNHNAGEIHISFKNYLPTLDLSLFKTLKCFYFNRITYFTLKSIVIVFKKIRTFNFRQFPNDL